jgi:lipoprotein Spr
MHQNTNNLKKIVVLSALLFVCGTGSLKAQYAVNTLTIFSNKQLLALNFLNNISLSSVAKTHTDVNTSKDNIDKTKVSAETVSENTIETLSSTQFKYAMMMDVDVEELTNKTLYTFIDDWYGTHYRMGGNTKKGIDCSAFSGTLLASIYTFNVPRTAREQYKICERLDKENLMTGDLVFFNTRGGVSHVGVYLANNRFVHASSSNGITISNLDDNYYAKKFISGGRINQ